MAVVTQVVVRGPSPHSSLIRLRAPFETGFSSVALCQSCEEEGEGKKLGHSGALEAAGAAAPVAFTSECV